MDVATANVGVLVQALQNFDMGPPHDAVPGSSQVTLQKVAGSGDMNPTASLFCAFPLPMTVTVEFSNGASATTQAMPTCLQ